MATIIRQAAAGTEDSADVIVSVEPADQLHVEIHSTLYAQFSAAIEKTVREVLAEQNVTAGKITVQDKGALDWILRARTEAALGRGKGE